MISDSLPGHLHAGLAPNSLALAMVLAHPEVTSAVIGAELPAHFTDAALAATLSLQDAVIGEACQLTVDLPPTVINPSLWPKAD